MQPEMRRGIAVFYRALLIMTVSGLAYGCTLPPLDPNGPLGGERVFVLNSWGESLSVIDHATRSVARLVRLNGRPHGQIASADGRRLYVTTGGGQGEVIALDTGSLNILWRLSVGKSLHQPALTQDDRWLFVPDFRRDVLAVIDVGEARLDQQLPLGEGPHPLMSLHNAFAGGSGRFVYQTAVRSDAVARVDVDTRTIDRVYRLPGHPRPIALLSDESRMYVQLSDLHGFIEIDLESGKETRRIEWPIPAGATTGLDADIAAAMCHGLAIPPDETEIWAASTLTQSVHILRLPDLVELAHIPLDGTPEWIAFSRDGNTGYIPLTAPHHAEGSVAVIDRNLRNVLAVLPVGPEPRRVLTVLVPTTPTP